MTWDLNTIANLSTALAVAFAAAFGILQWRQADRKRRDAAAMALIQSTQSIEVFEAAWMVARLPEGTTAEELDAMPGMQERIWRLYALFEPMGYMVYGGVLPLRILDDMGGGVVRLTWKRLKPWAERDRRLTGSANAYEWYQWLAERLEQYPAPGKQEGAHVAHADWKP